MFTYGIVSDLRRMPYIRVALLLVLFRVRSHDVGFSLRRRTMRCGGAVEEDLIDARRYPAGVGVVGDWTARESCQVVARFDNEYSIFTAKRVRAGAAGG